MTFWNIAHAQGYAKALETHFFSSLNQFSSLIKSDKIFLQISIGLRVVKFCEKCRIFLFVFVLFFLNFITERPLSKCKIQFLTKDPIFEMIASPHLMPFTLEIRALQEVFIGRFGDSLSKIGGVYIGP